MTNLFLLLAFERSTLKCKSNLVKNSKNLQKKIFYMRHSINFEPFFQASFSKLNYIMCPDIILITNHQHLLKNIISFHCSTWQNAQMKVNLCQIIEFLLKKNLAFAGPALVQVPQVPWHLSIFEEFFNSMIFLWKTEFLRRKFCIFP